MTLTFFELCSVYKKGIFFFPYLLVNFFEQRYISSVKSYKHLYKFIRIKTMVSKNTMYMRTNLLIKL